MTERIYLSTTDGIEPLEEKAFDLEAELQKLIADHPELLDGDPTHLEPCRFALSRAQICSIGSASSAALILRIATGA